MEASQRELQLLLQPSSNLHSEAPRSLMGSHPTEHPQLDLNLSISVGTLWPPAKEEPSSNKRDLQLLKQQTAEQIKLVAVEKAYVERTKELTRRELELAKKEFARARLVWERAREEVKKVERMKEIATRRINATCLEITCHSCHQRFRP